MSTSNRDTLFWLGLLIDYNADPANEKMIFTNAEEQKERLLEYHRLKDGAGSSDRCDVRNADASYGRSAYIYKAGGKSPHPFGDEKDPGQTEYEKYEHAFAAYIQSWLDKEILIFHESIKNGKLDIQRNLMMLLFYLICSDNSESVGLCIFWPPVKDTDGSFESEMNHVIRSLFKRVAVNPSSNNFKYVMKRMISLVGDKPEDIDRTNEKEDVVVGGLGSLVWKKIRTEIMKKYKPAKIAQSLFLYNQANLESPEKKKADMMVEILEALGVIFSDNMAVVSYWKQSTLEYVDDFLDGLAEVETEFLVIFGKNPEPNAKNQKTGQKGKAPARASAAGPSSLTQPRTASGLDVDEMMRKFDEEQKARIEAERARLEAEREAYRKQLQTSFLVKAPVAKASGSSSSSAPAAPKPSLPAKPRDRSPIRVPKESKPLTKDQILRSMSFYDKACWYEQMCGAEKFVEIVSTFAPAGKTKPTHAGECVALVYSSKKGEEIFEKLAKYLAESRQEDEGGAGIEVALRTFFVKLTAEKAKIKEEFSAFSPKGAEERKKIYGYAKRLFGSRKEAIEYLFSFLSPADKNGNVDQATIESGNALINKFLETVPFSVKRSEILRKSGDESAKGKLVAFFEKGFLDDTIRHDRLIECILHMLSLDSEGKMNSFVLVLSERYNLLPISKSRSNKEDHLPFYLSYKTSPEESRHVGVVMRSVKNIKSSRRVINSMFITLMKNPNRKTGLQDIHITQAISMYPEPIPRTTRTGKEILPSETEIFNYKAIKDILRNLANLESPEDIDVFTYIFHPKEASENSIDQTMSTIFEHDLLPTATLVWLFFVAAGMFFDPSVRLDAIEGVIFDMKPIIRLLPRAPFNGVKMSNVVKYIFQLEPSKFTTKQRLLVSYMFDNHLVFQPGSKHRTVNANAEKFIYDDRESKEIKAKKSILRKQYEGEPVDDIAQVKTTDWLRHNVRKVLGHENLLEKIADTLKERKINFTRPHALWILFDMYNNPQEHFHKSPEAEIEEATLMVEKEYATRERREEGRIKEAQRTGRSYNQVDRDIEKEAEKKKNKIEEVAKKLPEIRKAKIMSLMSKGSMVRKEEDTYGDTFFVPYSEDDAKIIYGYDFKTYPEDVGDYQGIPSSNKFQNGVTFNNNEARALKKIMEEEHIYPPVEFVQLWNDTLSLGEKVRDQLAKYKEAGNFDESKIHIKALVVKKRIYDAMVKIWTKKSFRETERGEQIGFTVSGYQSPLTMLNLLRVFDTLTVGQYLTLVKASLYTELGRANKYIQETVRILSARAEKDKKAPVVSPQEAIHLIIRSRNLVNDYVRKHKENLKSKIAEKNEGGEESGLLEEIQRGAGLNTDDLAEINKDTNEQVANDNSFVAAGDRSGDDKGEEEEEEQGGNSDADDDDDEEDDDE